MRTWSWLLISLGLLAAALSLMVSHLRAWRKAALNSLGTESGELDYRRAQYRRRMQTSAMLAIVAMALLAGHWVRCPPLSPTVFAVYWALVLLVVAWLVLLAVADIVSTKYHYGQIRDRYVLEEAKLKAELRKIERIRGNGEPESEAGDHARGGEDGPPPP